MVDKKISEQMELIKWLAIISIFNFHFIDTIVRYKIISINGVIEKAFHIGSQGIHIFFILSIFFLYIKYVHYQNEFKIFTRIKKLYPQYLLSVLFVILIYFIYGKSFSLEEILINILPIIRNLFTEYIRTINGNWWFLHTLIEFYIFIKFTQKLLPKLSNNNLIIYTILIYISYVLFYTYLLDIDSQSLNPFSSFFINYIYDFTIGVILARYYVSNKLNIENIYILILLGIVFEGIGYLVTKKFGIFGYNINDIFFALGILFLILGISKLLQNKFKIFTEYLIGNSSIIYFIYLIHHSLIIIFTDIINISNYYFLLLTYCFSLFVTIICSIYLYKLSLLIILEK